MHGIPNGGPMSVTVCLAPANTVGYPKGGGPLWEYIHWALSLRAVGCRVLWLDAGGAVATSANAW